MIRFKDLISEGVISPVLYHVTDIGRTLSILDENKFRLTPAYGSGSDMKLQKEKLYFLSASRVKYGGYARTQSPTGSVTIELDGKELGNNYTSVNVDYWGDEIRKSAKASGNIERFMKYDENEERIITDDPEIEPASKYIKSLHVSIGDPSLDEPSERKEKTKKRLKQLERFSNNLDIPIYFYTDPQNWKRQRKGKAYTSISELFPNLNDVGEYEKEVPPIYSEGVYLPGVVDILKKDKIENLSEEGQKVYKKLRGKGVPRNFDKVLKSDIHNNRSNPKLLDKIKFISRQMKKAGKSSIEGLVEILNKKVNKLEKQDKKRLYKKYKDAVDSIFALYKLRGESEITESDLHEEGGSLDAVGKYFQYISQGKNIEDFEKSSASETAFRTTNEIGNLMELGYFDQLKSIVKKETESDVMARRFRKFMDNVIQPVIYRIAYNEDWISYYQFNK